MVPWYKAPSATKMRDTLLPQHAARVDRDTTRILKSTSNLTSSFDGITTPHAGESIYTHHVTTPSSDEFLIKCHHCTGNSHTELYLYELIQKDIEKVGAERFSVVVSDNAGNVRVCCEIIHATYPWILNLADPLHLLNNLAKDIAKIPEIQKLMKVCARIANHFCTAHKNGKVLDKIRRLPTISVSGGLETMNKTRFLTGYRCM